MLRKIMAFGLIPVIGLVRQAEPEKLLETIINSRQGFPIINQRHFFESVIMLVPTISLKIASHIATLFFSRFLFGYLAWVSLSLSLSLVWSEGFQRMLLVSRTEINGKTMSFLQFVKLILASQTKGAIA